MKYVGIDFEFFNSNEEKMDVVACVIHDGVYTQKYNCLLASDVEKLKKDLDYIQRNEITLLAYAAMAEARALLSLGIDPFQFQWIDLYVEFIMLCNSNNRYSYGNYINTHGDICYSTPPDPSMTEEEKEDDTEDRSECPKNLINCAYKMLGIRLDLEEKNTMRDLILSKDLVKIHAHMDQILEYCASDTRNLRAIHSKINLALKHEGLEDFEQDQLCRGEYAVAVAKSEALGIPINMELLQKIIGKTPEILKVHEREVNEYFNYFLPAHQKAPILRKNGSLFMYKPTPAKKDMAAYQVYVHSLKVNDFPRTKTGKFKSDNKTLEIWRSCRGIEALRKYNKVESSLKWFNKDNKNGFFERLGSDENVRPYYGIFGTQTGRNAAKAKTFPLAMSSWLRAIVSPKLEKSTGAKQYIISSDFSQQEVYVAASLSNDQNLMSAYNSGDVYLAFAKQAGIVPESATKSSHKQERNLCKSTVLGLTTMRPK